MVKSKRIIFELNEFNVDLLEESATFRPCLKKILNSKKIDTTIPDSYDSDFLEPWSQWVSVHTGKPTKDHKIKHLGDVENLKYSQVWDNNPHKFGVIWGCLNAKNPADKDIIFFPDPWTKSSKTNNKKLINLESFLRNAVSDRGNGFLSKASSYLSLILSAIKIVPLLVRNLDFQFIKLLLSTNPKTVLNISSIYACVEYISFNQFISMSKLRDKNIDVFFANMQAHAQHYYWGTDNHPRIDFTLDLVEMMLKKIFAEYDEIVMINGLTQEYSADKEIWNSFYPAIGWDKFIKKYISKDVIVQPCMSYDAILHFNSEIDLENAVTKINSIKTASEDKNIFITEKYENQLSKLFIRFDYTGNENCQVILNNSTFEFNSIFKKLATRTARHIQICNSYINFDNDKDYKNNWELEDLYQ